MIAEMAVGTAGKFAQKKLGEGILTHSRLGPIRIGRRYSFCVGVRNPFPSYLKSVLVCPEHMTQDSTLLLRPYPCKLMQRHQSSSLDSFSHSRASHAMVRSILRHESF